MRMDTKIFNTAGSYKHTDALYTHSKSKHMTAHMKETSAYNECIRKYNCMLLPFLLSTSRNSWEIPQYFKVAIIQKCLYIASVCTPCYSRCKDTSNKDIIFREHQVI